VKALSEELENPLNVHRWRKLEGSDPATFEMIQKIQTLQRRLVAKTEETAEKDALIAEKERLYGELKSILARQPGPELAEQLSVYQQNLREKNRQLKSVASELNLYRSKSDDAQMEIERLTRELNELKRKYYETKRREQLERSREYADPELVVAPHPPTQKRFAGGGFGFA
jgi:chromosome segregation ATPase